MMSDMKRSMPTTTHFPRERRLITAMGWAIACTVALAAGPARTQELGDASVLSYQGQRLKIAIPYGSTPNQRVAVTRFAVESVSVPRGFRAPDPRLFTLSKPERRNIVYLQSQEFVDAPSARLVLTVADGEVPKVAYDLAIPPMRYAQAADDETAASQAVSSEPAKRRAGKRRGPRARG